MAIKNPFKLQKLQIKVYTKPQRTGLPQHTLKAMFNPASFSVRHENTFSTGQGLNTSGRQARYAYTRSSEIALELVFDGTEVTDFGAVTALGKGEKSVGKQIRRFLKACFYMDGELHEPKYLKLQWGDAELKEFSCRLQSVDVEYTAFDRDGSPLHATLKATFVEDREPGKRLRQENKSSPDLSHARVVKAGDTLPLLTKEIYGSSHHYIRVAQANGLDDFRNLTPGQTIVFPPLDQTA
jgi:LysM repeat protein